MTWMVHPLSLGGKPIVGPNQGSARSSNVYGINISIGWLADVLIKPQEGKGLGSSAAWLLYSKIDYKNILLWCELYNG